MASIPVGDQILDNLRVINNAILHNVAITGAFRPPPAPIDPTVHADFIEPTDNNKTGIITFREKTDGIPITMELSGGLIRPRRIHMSGYEQIMAVISFSDTFVISGPEPEFFRDGSAVVGNLFNYDLDNAILTVLETGIYDISFAASVQGISPANEIIQCFICVNSFPIALDTLICPSNVSVGTGSGTGIPSTLNPRVMMLLQKNDEIAVNIRNQNGHTGISLADNPFTFLRVTSIF